LNNDVTGKRPRDKEAVVNEKEDTERRKKILKKYTEREIVR